LGFRSFDRIPRNHAPLVITVLLIVVAAVSVFARRSVHNISDQTAGVATSVRSKASGLKTFVGTKLSTP
jgi:hypothetical protein